MFAPGASITSAGIGSDTASDTKSGSLMSSPCVAGVAALHLSGAPTSTPAKVASEIVNTASPGKLVDLVGSPNDSWSLA